MSQIDVAGTMKEYISKIEFSLNFEERDKAGKQVSAKIKINDHVFYDGITAKFRKSSGEEITGKAKLSGAIASNWLYLVGSKPGPVNLKVPGGEYKIKSDYDSLRGGDFDKMLSEEFKTSKLVKEEDLIVKKTEKIEVSNDQVEVKPVTVSSSTASPSQKTSRKVSIMKSEGSGADNIVDVTFKSDGSKKTSSKKSTFTVDEKTPKPHEDATLKEIKRVTVDQVDGSQDARVVSKVGEKPSRKKMEIEEQDARVVTKTKVPVTTEEGIVFNKTETPKEKIEVKVGNGSTPIADLSEAKTQADVNAIEKKSTSNYLSMLPENWATMHWVKKESFIKTITDKEFIHFIMTVENIKAVQLACKKRLTELEKLGQKK